MFQVSGRNLLASGSVLLCLFTFEFESESRTNIIAGFCCIIGFSVNETAN